ncbi:hypothetical protein EON79_06895, partial [bacterium]
MTDPYVFRLFGHLGIPLREVVPIVDKGSVNAVYRVEKEDGHTIILRLNRDRGPEEAEQEYHRESWCLGRARGA